MESLKRYLVTKDENLKSAIKKLDEGARKILFVTDNDGLFFGVLSDGDIRRWIIKTGGIDAVVYEVCNRTAITLEVGHKSDQISSLFKEHKITSIPVIDSYNRIIEIIFSEEFFSEAFEKNQAVMDLPVIIMAGGKGTRLEPFTRILPKPLIPIGEKPIIEIIMDRFAKFGMTEFYVSLNHKAKMIKSYFEDQDLDYSINYIEEDKPLGTAGAIKILQDKIDKTCFVSNCDIIVDDNYLEIYNFHHNGNFDLSLVACMQNHQIPYGVCEIETGGILVEIREKPEYDFLVNTGMYIMNPNMFQYIPNNSFYHITDLIKDIMKNGGKVGVYPVSEKSWIDVGQWEEYKKAVIHFTI